MRTERQDTVRTFDRGTVGFGLAFVALGLFMVVGARAMTPLGAVFPRTIGWAMIVIAAILVVTTVLRGLPPRRYEPGSTLRRSALVAIMAAWVVLLPTLGFFATSGLAFAGLLVVANYDGWTLRRVVLYGGAAVALLTGFYFLFVELLHVPAPGGLLF